MSKELIELKKGNVRVKYEYKFDAYETVTIKIYGAEPEEHYRFTGMYLKDLIKLLKIIDSARND